MVFALFPEHIRLRNSFSPHSVLQEHFFWGGDAGESPLTHHEVQVYNTTRNIFSSGECLRSCWLLFWKTMVWRYILVCLPLVNCGTHSSSDRDV